MNLSHEFCNSLSKTVLIITMCVASLTAYSQVGIDVPSPDPSTVLDLDGADNARGLLVPRMNSTERQAIPAPADGLLVYDTDQKMFYHYDAGLGKWQAVNPFSYRKGSSAADEDNFVVTFTNDKSFVIGNVTTPTAKLEVGGNIKGSGNLEVTGTVTSNGVTTSSVSTGTMTTTGSVTVGTGGEFVGYGTIPLGGIIMWSGTVVPTGWALCDGSTSNGFTTPDLRGRFIAGYHPGDADYNQPGNLSRKITPVSAGETGGVSSVTLTVGQMPSHSHGGTTTSNGGHFHYYTRPNFAEGYEAIYNNSDEVYKWNYTGDYSTSTNGDHTHTINSEGGGQPHENRPPYYVLAFIMRVQ